MNSHIIVPVEAISEEKKHVTMIGNTPLASPLRGVSSFSLEALADHILTEKKKDILMMIENTRIDMQESTAISHIFEEENRRKKEQEKLRRKHANTKKLYRRK
jgi:hypothetical protein